RHRGGRRWRSPSLLGRHLRRHLFWDREKRDYLQDCRDEEYHYADEDDQCGSPDEEQETCGMEQANSQFQRYRIIAFLEEHRRDQNTNVQDSTDQDQKA